MAPRDVCSGLENKRKQTDCADLERGQGGWGRVPEGDKPDGQGSPGDLRSAPQGIVAAESGHAPAKALLNRRQARFAYRLHSRPKDGEGPEETLDREVLALTTRLRAAASLRPGDRDPGVGGPPVFPRPGRCGEQGRRATDCWILEPREHHLYRRLPTGQWQVEGGMRLEGP